MASGSPTCGGLETSRLVADISEDGGRPGPADRSASARCERARSFAGLPGGCVVLTCVAGVATLALAAAAGPWRASLTSRRGSSADFGDLTVLAASDKLAAGSGRPDVHPRAEGAPDESVAEQAAALRSQVAALSAEVSQLSSRNAELEAAAWSAGPSANCTEHCARLNRGGRWRFGHHGHECPDPVTQRAFCHCSHQPNRTEACDELVPVGVRRLRSRRGSQPQALLEPDAGLLAGREEGTERVDVEAQARALQGEPQRGAAELAAATAELEAAAAPPRQLGSASDTIETYCNTTGLMEMHGAGSGVTTAAQSLDKTGLNQLESSILADVTDELENNNVDKAARDIFTFYVCLRWVPDEMFWKLARQELATNLVRSVVDHKKHLDHAISELYQQYKYVPLLCSENYDVFGELDPDDNTHFRTFKKKMTALSQWLKDHKEDHVVDRLKKVDEVFCDGKNMNDPGCNAGVAFDTWLNGATKSLGSWRWNRKTFSDKWSAMYHLFQTFTPENAEEPAFASDLTEWKAKFPFQSFVHKSDGMPATQSPQSDQRFLVCFGKRVASELHRRPSGRHLLTDQNNIGCHGFWTINEVTDMIQRMVELWKPPTCQLAEMTFVMKKRLLAMYQQMNERLFDALPTLLMDEDLTEAGLLDAHVAGPPPYDRKGGMVGGREFVGGMRVRATSEVRDPPGCKIPGRVSGLFSKEPDCRIYVPEGGYGTVVIRQEGVLVAWDAKRDTPHPVYSASDVAIVPHDWHRHASLQSKAGDLVAGVGSIFDGTKALFDGLSRSRYTSLASLMSNSTSKWVVCPVRSDANYSELDGQLGVEDAALKSMQQEAYAKWTGFQGHLPGEECAPEAFLPAASFPGGQTCEIAELHADHVERYTNDDGSAEQFICPVKQNLPAAEQLQVLEKKGGQCLLRMTPEQQRQYQWPYNGDYPSRRQFDRKANDPRNEFELVKLLHVPRGGSVSFARTCGPDERIACPRFCRATKIYNPWPSVAGAAQALAAIVAGGSFGMGASAISQSIEEYKRTLSQNKNATALLGDTAHLVGEQLWDQLTGAGRLLNTAVDSAVSSVEHGLPGSAKRSQRMEAEFFESSDAGLLLHQLSYQRSIGANLRTSNAKERFQRFVVTMPCPDFDPAMEFALKKKWTAVALQMVQSAVHGGPEDVLDVPYVELALRGEGRLFQRTNKQASEDHWFTYGAAMQAISSNGKAVSLPDCSWSWGGCHPGNKCTRSGLSCVPKVRLAPNSWWSVRNRQLISEVAPSISAGNQDVSALVGVTVALYCGKKSDFNDNEPGPVASPSFKECLLSGIETNARLQAREPWKLFWPEEVVVVAVFGTVTERQCKPADGTGLRGELCASGAEEAKDLDAHLTHSDKSSSDGVYQGLHAGAGFPQGTPHEVVLRPEDVLEVARLLSRG